jgi:RNA polymerase-binding transcription factor DksA
LDPGLQPERSGEFISMDAREIEEARQKLLKMREQWARRLTAIEADRRRSGELEKDFEEQATQRENDEVLDGLDETGRHEVEGIDAALDRIEAGTFGICVVCEETIPSARIAAAPAAIRCKDCASAAG